MDSLIEWTPIDWRGGRLAFETRIDGVRVLLVQDRSEAGKDWTLWAFVGKHCFCDEDCVYGETPDEAKANAERVLVEGVENG